MSKIRVVSERDLWLLDSVKRELLPRNYEPRDSYVKWTPFFGPALKVENEPAP
jgi:hypothetical protein